MGSAQPNPNFRESYRSFMKPTFLLFPIVLMLALTAQADDLNFDFAKISTSENTTFEGHYQFDLSKLYSRLKSDLATNDQGSDCSHRAEVWAYQLSAFSHIPVEKVLVLFTKDVSPRNWNYHIAPVVKLNNEKYVFERANGIDRPLKLADWLRVINRGESCEESSYHETRFSSGFIKGDEGVIFYDRKKVSGECIALIVSPETYAPGNGFLPFGFASSKPLKHFGRDRAVGACAEGSIGVWKRVNIRTLEYDPQTFQKAQVTCENEIPF
jgi:hypothetical protein